MLKRRSPFKVAWNLNNQSIDKEERPSNFLHRQLLHPITDAVIVTDKALQVILLTYLIIKPDNRKIAGRAAVAAFADNAKLCGGLLT
jgi:hypothetical protein